MNIECDDPKIETITRELFARNHILIEKTSPRRLVVRATKTQIMMRFEEPGQPAEERTLERDASSAVTQDTAAHIALSLVEPEVLVPEPSVAPLPATPPEPSPSSEPKPIEPPIPEPKPLPEKPPARDPSQGRVVSPSLHTQPIGAAFVGASFGVGTFSTSRIGLLPRLEGGVRFGGFFQPHVVLSAGAILGENHEAPGLASETTWIPVRLQGGLSPALSRNVITSLSARLGVDYLRVSARALDVFTRTGETVERAQPMVGLGGALQGYVWGNLSLVGHASLDFDLAPRAFVVNEAPSTRSTFATSRMQAEISIGIRVDFAGERP